MQEQQQSGTIALYVLLQSGSWCNFRTCPTTMGVAYVSNGLQEKACSNLLSAASKRPSCVLWVPHLCSLNAFNDYNSLAVLSLKTPDQI